MGKLDEVTLDFALYEDKTEYYGIPEVTMPSIDYMTTTLQGAGIAGEYEEVLTGMLKAMSIGLKFNDFEKKAISLAAPKDHHIDLRTAKQNRDTTAGTVNIADMKHVFVIFPKTTNAGKIAPASTADASGDYTVKYWAAYIDGEKYLEIDPLNGVCFIDGTDYYAPIRKALGK